MATTVYVVRHGATPWTRAERVQGWASVPLSGTGREGMRSVAAELSSRIDADRLSRVLSSDLPRAEESAELVAEAFDPSPAVETDPAWRERDFGIYQGLDDERYERLYKSGVDSRTEKVLRTPENGESWRDVETRVLEAWRETKAALSADETVVLVSHYGPIHCLLAWAAGRRLEAEFRDGGYDVGGISRIVVEDGRERLVERNGTVLE